MADNKLIISEIKNKLARSLEERNELRKRVRALEFRNDETSNGTLEPGIGANGSHIYQPATTAVGDEKKNTEMKTEINRLITEIDGCLTLLNQ